MEYSSKIVCDVIDYIETNLNYKITIDDISKKLFYDRYYLMKLFKKELGVSIVTFIKYFRIYHSVNDIRNTTYSLTKIALFNGFTSLEYFSEVFHQVIGVSPRDYRLFSKRYFKFSQNKTFIILSHWIQLQSFIDFVHKYKNNRKPVVAPVRKLSIFY